MSKYTTRDVQEALEKVLTKRELKEYLQCCPDRIKAFKIIRRLALRLFTQDNLSTEAKE